MKQYLLTRQLRPELLPAYNAAFWLVTRLHRGSGRTTVLAAAFLKEACLGNSSQLWDHAAPPNQLDFLKDRIRVMANNLKLKVRIDSKNILRTAEGGGSYGPVGVLKGEDKEIVRESLRAAVKSAMQAGMSDKAIENFVSLTIRETVVEEVHSR